MFAATHGSVLERSTVLLALTLLVAVAGCRSEGAPAGDETGHGGETAGTLPGDQADDTTEPASPLVAADTSEGAPVVGAAPTDDDDATAGTPPRDDEVSTTLAPPGDAREPRPATPPALTGGVDPMVVAAIRRVMAPIRACYEQELARNPAFQGGDPPPTVRPVEGRDGTVRMTLVGTSGSARVDRCLRNALRRMSFPRDDSPVHVQYPFLFSPDGASRDLPVGG